MQTPLFVRPPTEEERQTLAAGLRSADAFTLRRSQIVLASARGERVAAIARSLGCTAQTVRATLARLGLRWRRAKDWITSPDPAYAQKNGGATA